MNIRSAVPKIVFALSALAILPAASSVANSDRELRSSATNVSIVQLLANPKSYHGRLIRVDGYVNLEFEGNAIYLHKEDFDFHMTSNSFWLNAAKCIGPDKKPFTTGYASVIGTFDSTDNGHLGQWPGAISVKLCELRPPRNSGPIRYK
jgi:hypothetical protein